MKKIQYDFACQYTQFPGGRYITQGKFSGEHFRQNVLEPIFQSNDIIIIDATNVHSSFSPSFLDEAFGLIAIKYGIEKFNNTIQLFSKTNTSLTEKMTYYVNLATKRVIK